MENNGTSTGTFLVGGAVRDELLGRPVSDRDWVVVGRTPEEMLAEGYTQVGKDFPVFLHPESHEEYALARTERKTASGHLGFECHAGVDVTLEEDLARRDLTVNALAKSADGKLIDPYGGEQDLRDGVLRHVSPAFTEDPLRVLRVARFAAQLGFVVAPETLELMRAMARDNVLAELPAERVWQEFHKALGCMGAPAFVQVMRSADALSPWFEELKNLEELKTRDTGTDLELSIYGATALQRFGSFALLLEGAANSSFSSSFSSFYSLSQRLKVPRRYERFATAAADHAGTLSGWFRENPRDLLTALTKTGALRPDAREQQEDFLALLDLLTEAFGEFDAGSLAVLARKISAIGAADAVALLQRQGREAPRGPEMGEAIADLRIQHIKGAQGRESS